MIPTQDTRPRLLVVDDEPTNLQVLRHVLDKDYRLLFATDGTRALQLARQQQPRLVLLDVMMPGMDGYAVCAALKADPATAAIPVIFVTALTDAADETRGFDAGGVDYITKPVSAPWCARACARTCRWCVPRSCAKRACKSCSAWAAPPSTRTTKPACTSSA